MAVIEPGYYLAVSQLVTGRDFRQMQAANLKSSNLSLHSHKLKPAGSTSTIDDTISEASASQ